MNELRADLTNIPTSGRPAVSCSVTRTKNCIAMIAVKSYIRHKQLFSCLDRKLSNFKHFHISAMSNNRITANYEFFVN